MRPKKDNHLKRTIRIHVCLTPAERDKIMKHFKLERFPSFSEFVRYHLLKNRDVKIIGVDKEFVTLFRTLDYELAKLGNNMNQIAHNLNSYNTCMLSSEDMEVIKDNNALLKLCRESLDKHLQLLNLK